MAEHLFTEERVYYPIGYDPDDDWHVQNVFGIAVGVWHRGNGKWMVSPTREGHEQLSSTGKWLWLPLKMTALQHCRFDFETACRLAEGAVDSHTQNGRNWAQWLEWKAEREADR